ncbi:hypothetical protein AB0D27_03365 [Streptomyces sp. NPDC048415]|uniref:hypothetical protein n=1 Tax=Streptomyces sp. NPDC048415 TaxID=3154822 RepID=UPI00341AFBAE
MRRAVAGAFAPVGHHRRPEVDGYETGTGGTGIVLSDQSATATWPLPRLPRGPVPMSSTCVTDHHTVSDVEITY